MLYEPVDTRPHSLQEEEVQKQQQQLQEDRQEWQRKKEEYQKDLERLRDAQRKLERDKEAVQRQFDKMGDVRLSEVSIRPVGTSCSPSLTVNHAAVSLPKYLPEFSSSIPYPPVEDSLHHIR